MTWTHFKAEGEVEFKALLFVPAKVRGNEKEKVSS